MGASWGPLGGLLGALGGSWGLLGASGGLSGASRAPLGEVEQVDMQNERFAETKQHFLRRQEAGGYSKCAFRFNETAFLGEAKRIA